MSNALNQLKNVPVEKLTVLAGFNTRHLPETAEGDEELMTLAEDIKENGLANPIRVTPGEDGNFILVAGHRRLLAIQFANDKLGAGIKSVMAIVTKELTDEQRDAILLADRLSSQLKPLEAATAMQRFIDRGMSQTDVAKRFKMTVAYAGDLKLLANAPEAIKEAVSSGLMAATEAVRTVKTYGPENAETIVKEAVAEEQATTLPASTAEASGDPSVEESEAVDEPPAPTAKKPRLTRAKTERIAKAKNIAPRREKPSAAPKGDTEDTESLPELASRVANYVDRMIGFMKIGDNTAARSEITNMAFWLRSYQQAGFRVEGNSGITGDTPDNDLEFVTEEVHEADKAA